MSNENELDEETADFTNICNGDWNFDIRTNNAIPNMALSSHKWGYNHPNFCNNRHNCVQNDECITSLTSVDNQCEDRDQQRIDIDSHEGIKNGFYYVLCWKLHPAQGDFAH